MTKFILEFPWIIPFFFLVMAVLGIGLKTDDNEKKIKELEKRIK